ncbi:MAG: long-chain fatty acid--CoA ligase [Deltaproteobacteria bacterium HGW-Deltaproteobacteria-10]|nr:MAG: long-chain fatty acid--CoA ligase [Deltaproteobacteria bacterium HGW-Deltaproteobacteria-10]
MAGAISTQEKQWLKSYQKGVPEKINYEEICMPDILERTVSKFPGNIALIFQGYQISYSQMKDMVDRFATCLTDFGVKKGDSVALLLPNVIPCVVAYYAILKIGAINVMNNPLYSDPELEHQFNDSGSKVLITLDLLGNRMIDLRPKTKIKQIVITSIGDYLPFPKSLLFPLVAKKKNLAADVKAAPDVYRWKDCIAKYQPNPPKVKNSFSDVAMYQYTGGTTGVSKGVELTHGNLSKQVQQLAAWFPSFDPGAERMLGALPYFHVFGMSTCMNFSVSMGWTQILIPKPQPEPLLEAIHKFKPTFAPLVPTMYIGMLSHPDIKKTDMSCIKGAFSGSAPLPVEVIADFEKITGAVIVEGFGMTETCPVTHINPFAGGARKVGSVGLPISDTLARIVDLENGVDDMPIGERGELIVQGPQIMRGYKGKPEETANTLKDGWIYTGDIATMDEDGYFYIVDRKKDMIISGGYNVYPRDIDEVYYTHPKVQEACSIGVPDAKRGETVKIFIVLKEGETSTQEEMIEFGKGSLAVYKLPTEVEFRKELPKTNVGKILRKELRAEELKKRKK